MARSGLDCVETQGNRCCRTVRAAKVWKRKPDKAERSFFQLCVCYLKGKPGIKGIEAIMQRLQKPKRISDSD